MHRLPSARLSRREFWCDIAAATVAAALPRVTRSVESDKPRGMSLCSGNYGMQALKVEDAVTLIADVGFDGVELSVMPDWPSSPDKLPADRRRALRKLLDDRGVALVSLMEDLPPSAADAEHEKQLARLKHAAGLGRDLSPDAPPLIQTVLGGGTWGDRKTLFRDRLGDWLRVAEAHDTVIAIKPHRSGAMSQPAHALWLFEQLEKNRRLGMVYDYSHYAFRDLPIVETVKTAFPITLQIAVKDAVRKGEQVEFDLPGEAGTIDYREILLRFHEQGYRGSVCCEVSSQVFRRAGYDPAAAARISYAHISQTFEKAGIVRRRPASPAPRS